MLVPNCCNVENPELAVFNGNGENELVDFGTCVDVLTERVTQVTIDFTRRHCSFYFRLSYSHIVGHCSLSKKLWRLNSFTLPKMEQLKQILLRVTRAGKRLLFLSQTSPSVTRQGKKKQRENMFLALNLCANLQQIFDRQAGNNIHFSL